MQKSTCSIEGCESRARKRGWCEKHYRRYQRHGDPLGGGRRSPLADVCSIEGCDLRPKARDLCKSHYHKQLLTESPAYRENQRASFTNWAAENPERNAERLVSYREDNRDALRDYDRRRYAENPGLMYEKGYIRRRQVYGLPALVTERVEPSVVFDRDGGQCGICGTLVEPSRSYPDPLCGTVDHIIPVRHPDSEHSYANVQLAHWDCNRKKSTMEAPEKPLIALQ